MRNTLITGISVVYVLAGLLYVGSVEVGADERPTALTYSATIDVAFGATEPTRDPHGDDHGEWIEGFGISRGLAFNVRAQRARARARTMLAEIAAGIRFELHTSGIHDWYYSQVDTHLTEVVFRESFDIGAERILVAASTPATRLVTTNVPVYSIPVSRTFDLRDTSDAAALDLEYAIDNLIYDAVMEALDQDTTGYWNDETAHGYVMVRSAELTIE